MAVRVDDRPKVVGRGSDGRLERAPVVDAGGPYSGQVGADIVIDGASAQDPSDPTGETFTYTWDLDADGTFEKTGQQVDFVPEESGKFEIALKVQDKDGGEAIATAIVAVKAENNVDPVAGDDAIEIEEDDADVSFKGEGTARVTLENETQSSIIAFKTIDIMIICY